MANRWATTTHTSGTGAGRRRNHVQAAMTTNAVEAPTRKCVSQWNRASWDR